MATFNRSPRFSGTSRHLESADPQNFNARRPSRVNGSSFPRSQSFEVLHEPTPDLQLPAFPLLSSHGSFFVGPTSRVTAKESKRRAPEHVHGHKQRESTFRLEEDDEEVESGVVRTGKISDTISSKQGKPPLNSGNPGSASEPGSLAPSVSRLNLLRHSPTANTQKGHRTLELEHTEEEFAGVFPQPNEGRNAHSLSLDSALELEKQVVPSPPAKASGAGFIGQAELDSFASTIEEAVGFATSQQRSELREIELELRFLTEKEKMLSQTKDELQIRRKEAWQRKEESNLSAQRLQEEIACLRAEVDKREEQEKDEQKIELIMEEKLRTLLDRYDRGEGNSSGQSQPLHEVVQSLKHQLALRSSSISKQAQKRSEIEGKTNSALTIEKDQEDGLWASKAKVVAQKQAQHELQDKLHDEKQSISELQVESDKLRSLEQALVKFLSLNRTQPTPAEGVQSVKKKAKSVGKPHRSTPIKWVKGELLGEGAFSRVYSGFNQETGELIAVKEMKIDNVQFQGGPVESKAKALEDEINVMKDLDHPNIVRYLGTKRDRPEGKLYIFLEFVPGGSIASLLRRFGHFSEPAIKSFTRQILLGLDYLHDHKIIHGDIKSANLLVSESGVVKLADFGCSHRFDGGNSLVDGGNKELVGTIPYMAPEVLQQSVHGRKSDIWSVGCTVIEMVTGIRPWSEFSNQFALMFHVATTQAVPKFPETLSALGHDFLSHCCDRDINTRWTTKQLLEHPFLAETEEVEEQNSVRSSQRSRDDKETEREVYDHDFDQGSLNELLSTPGGDEEDGKSYSEDFTVDELPESIHGQDESSFAEKGKRGQDKEEEGDGRDLRYYG